MCRCFFLGLFLPVPHPTRRIQLRAVDEGQHTEEDVGLLVPLGFDITAFTPAAYQRGSLPRPYKDDSS